MHKLRNVYLPTAVLFLLLLIGSHPAMSKGQDKFEWYARDSAPKHYPMKVVRGTFIYHGEAEKGLYVPSGGTIDQGWGVPGTTHAVGEDYKPLPDRLQITFFSHTERQSYQGEFKLPYDRILELFRQGVAADKENPLYSDIMVGVAPGGAVAVWVTGRGDTKEVFFGQAEKIDLSLSAVFMAPFDSKEQGEAFARKVLADSLSPEHLAAIKKNGVPVGLWARYRTKYDWRPVLASGHTAEEISVIFLNGENKGEEWGGLLWASKDSKDAAPMPAPASLSFFSTLQGRKTLFEVVFDDREILSAFDKLSANGKKLYLEFEPLLPPTDLKIRVRNDKEVIELKKFVSKK